MIDPDADLAPLKLDTQGSMKPPRKLVVDTLAPEGFVETESTEDADLVILNTCHIREKASEKVYSEFRRLRVPKDEAARNGREIRIAVTGRVPHPQ